MKPCNHCGAAIENNAKSCDRCGEEQRPTLGTLKAADSDRFLPDELAQAQMEKFQEEREVDQLATLAGAFFAAVFVVGYLVAGVNGLIFGMLLVAACAIFWTLATGMS